MEYVIAALLCLLIIVILYLGLRLAKPAPPVEPDPRIDTILETLAEHRVALNRLVDVPEGLNDVRERLAAGGEQRRSMQEYLSETRRTIDGITQQLSGVSQSGGKSQELLERLHRVLMGASSRGKKGEYLLHEQLAAFPAWLLATNFHLGNGVVEFALRLPDDRVLPIDSKWPEPELVERLDKVSDPDEATRLRKQAESRVLRITRDIAKYIDPEKTVPLAVAALPDPVYTVAGGIHYEAFKQGVLLMPYSNAIPMLLAIYGLILRFGQRLNMEKVKGHLGALDTLLNELEKTIDDQLGRGGTMVINATQKCRDVTIRMRRSVAAANAPADQAKSVESDQSSDLFNLGDQS